MAWSRWILFSGFLLQLCNVYSPRRLLPLLLALPCRSPITILHYFIPFTFFQATDVGLLNVLDVCVKGLEAPLWGSGEQGQFGVIVCPKRILIPVSSSGSSSTSVFWLPRGSSFAVHFHPSCLLFFPHLLGLSLNVISSKRSSLIILFQVGSLIYSLALSFN